MAEITPTTADRSAPRRYSFSGADCKAYMCPHGKYELLTLIELSTISFSVHDAKGSARALGYRGIKGFARGLRTVAGSMILTVIEDNPFGKYLEMLGVRAPEYLIPKGWSADMEHIGIGTFTENQDFYNQLPTVMHPFDILLVFANEKDTIDETTINLKETRTAEQLPGRPSDEYGEVSTMTSEETIRKVPMVVDALIEAIEIIDYGQVTSIHDIVSEISLSFQARNVMPLSMLRTKDIINLDLIEDPKQVDVVYTFADPARGNVVGVENSMTLEEVASSTESKKRSWGRRK